MTSPLSPLLTYVQIYLSSARNIIGSIEGLENCSMPILEKLYLCTGISWSRWQRNRRYNTFDQYVHSVAQIIKIGLFRMYYTSYADGNYVKDMTPLIRCRFPKLQ